MLFSLARIWNSVPVVTFCSWKHTLTVESFSVNVWMLYIKFRIQVAVIDSALLFYEGIASQLCSFPERRRVHAISYSYAFPQTFSCVSVTFVN